MPMRYHPSEQGRYEHTPLYYDKHPRLAFVDGFHYKTKIKRHRTRKYDHYHYYLPSNISPILQFLKTYFRELDSQFGEIDEKHRYRLSEFEYPNLAMEMMLLIRARISANAPIVAGSQAISPLNWAIFGPNPDKLMCRHHFPKLWDVLKYYGNHISYRGFNITSVARPLHLDPGVDTWIVLADLFNHSVNFILACALLLLFDLVRYTGPDCPTFHPVFSNDRNARRETDLLHWDRARRIVIPDNKPDFGDLWVKQYGRHSITSQPCGNVHTYRTISYGKSYFDVEIKDVAIQSHADLTEGEKIEPFEVAKKSYPRTSSPCMPFWVDHNDLTEADFEEDSMVRELDEEYRRIISDHASNGDHENHRLLAAHKTDCSSQSEVMQDMREAREMARQIAIDWSGLH